MSLPSALADLARDHGTALFRDPVAFRGALDDYLDEGEASSGTINLLTDAVRLGALDGMLTMLDSGASVSAAVDSAGQRLARERGSTDTRSCQWACAVLGYALGAMPVSVSDELTPGTGSTPPPPPPAAHSAPPAPPQSWQQRPQQPPAQQLPQPPTVSPAAGFGYPNQQQPGYGVYPPAPPSYGGWQAPPPQKKRRTGLIVGLVALVVLLLGGVIAGVVAAASGGGDEPEAKGTSSASTLPTLASVSPSAPVPTASSATLPPSVSLAPSVPAGDGPILRGTGYKVRMPKGWTDKTREAGNSPHLDRVAVNSSTVSASTANVVIAKTEAYGITDPSSMRAGWESGMRETAKNVRIKDIPGRRIDGVRAIGADLTRSGVGSDLKQRAYLVIHGNRGYTVVFSWRSGDSSQSRVFETFLAGWAWNS